MEPEHTPKNTKSGKPGAGVKAIVLAFALGAVAQGTGAIEEASAAIKHGAIDLYMPDFDECAEDVMDKSSGPSLYDVAVRNLEARGAWNAKDIVSETLIEVCLKAQDKGLMELRPYFLRAARNRYVKEIRKFSRFSNSPPDWTELVSPEVGPEMAMYYNQQLVAFEECCHALAKTDCQRLKQIAYARFNDGEVDWSRLYKGNNGKYLTERQSRYKYNGLMLRLQDSCPGLDKKIIQ